MQNGDMSIDRPSSIIDMDCRAMHSGVTNTPALAQRFGLAYRAGDLSRAERLHTELFKLHFYKVQLFCERRILRMQTTLAIFESEDIAIEAWESVIHLIQNSSLEIKSEVHFIRLLFKTAKHRFLDRLRRNVNRISTVALERSSQDGSYTIEQDKEPGNATSDRPAWLSDNPTLDLLQCLFASEITFLNACAIRPRRRAKVYQSAVLYLLITETMIIETDIPHHVPYMLAACGLRQCHWDAFVAAMGPCEYPDLDTILAAVNVVFDTQIHSRKSISVLKYEFSQLIAHPRRRSEHNYGQIAHPQQSAPRGRSRRIASKPRASVSTNANPSPSTPAPALLRAPHHPEPAHHPRPSLRGNA
jgi:DNA-directed RNA polymerase specialized sigma24 family protein